MNCPHCGRELDLAQDQKYCTFCGGKLETAEGNGEEPPIDHPVITGLHDSEMSATSSVRHEAYCPWEDQEELGFVQGIVQTLKGTLFHPYDFFTAMPVTGGMLQPLLYALIVETVGAMMGFLWGVAMDNQILAGAKTVVGLLIPVLIFFKILVWALVLRLSLFLVGGATEEFEATFRVVCYCSGPELFNAVPIVGGFVGLGWKLYITAIGLKQVHRISIGKSVLAIALPSLFCCAAIGAVLIGALLA